MKTIYICWTDEFTNRQHVALWLFSGNDDDVVKAQEYVGNIGGKVLTYPCYIDFVSTAQARKDYEALLSKPTQEEYDEFHRRAKEWVDSTWRFNSAKGVALAAVREFLAYEHEKKN